MENNLTKLPAPDDPIWEVATAIENSVRAIRKARGRMNPEDCIRGTQDYQTVIHEFLLDVFAAMPCEGDEGGQDDFGATALG